MKTTLLIMTILLLFITLSSEVMAVEIQTTNEVEFMIEEESSEKEKETVLLVDSFQLPSINMHSIQPSTPFLDNHLSKDNTYKPPIF